jgi:3-hydroxy acid dehydrogenase / malonic semialdehyde reductase
MNRIEGRTAVVTGATSRIGEACARLLAAQGARLVLVARREDRLRSLADELVSQAVGVHTFRLDVRDRAAVEDLGRGLEAAGIEPDILVNNAGLARGFGPVHEGNPDDWEEMIDTNVKGLLYMTRAILPGMVRRNRGHVVNIGSVAGRWAYPAGNVYNASKFAVRGLTEAMNLDLFGTALRMSTVDPGMVQTEFAEVRFRGDTARAGKVYQDTQPLAPEDVADAVVYVLNAPPHVNITEMVIWPTAQRSAMLVKREPGPTA